MSYCSFSASVFARFLVLLIRNKQSLFRLAVVKLKRLFHARQLKKYVKVKSKTIKQKPTMQVPTQEPDYTLPESNLFDQLAHLDLQEHDSSPRTVSERPQSAGGDCLERELELVRHQKEKLQLELEVLRLRQMTAAPPATASQDESGQSGKRVKSRVSSGGLSKKRTIDWPQDFVPGMSVTSDFNALDLPAFFVPGYLAMIQLYDSETTNHMLDILELLMLGTGKVTADYGLTGSCFL